MRYRSLLTLTVATVSCLASASFAQVQQPHPGRPANPVATPALPAPQAPDDATTPLAVGTLYLATGNVRTADLPSTLFNLPAAFNPAAHYVIQLDGPITPQRREALQLLGVQLFDYLPAYAYLANLANVNPHQLAALNFVHWVGEYQSAWKIDPEVGRQNFFTIDRQQTVAQGFASLDVTLFRNAQLQPTIDALNRIPNLVVHRTEVLAGNPTITITLPLASVAQIAALADVQYIQEMPEVTPRNDSVRWIVQSNTLNVFPLYAAGLHGEGQIVGHMDGSININHCSFRDTANPVGPLHRKIISLNGTTGYDQHGTHTAATAVGDNFSDTGNTRGVAYLAKLTHSGIPSFTETSIFNALQTHFNQGARVHTNSWGNDGTTSYDGLCRAIDNFSYQNEDSLVCFAVTNTSTLKNPENAKNLLAVGASGDTPSQNNFCSGGTGPTSDSRRKPEIFSPGCNITSASGSGSTACTTASLTGTSMACPSVTGAAALVRQYYTSGYYPSGAANPSDAFTPTGALVKATLLNSAVDMTGISGYPSNQEGWGRLLADDSLYFAGQPRTMLVYDVRNNAGLSTGGQTNRTISVNLNSQKLKITLAWTDPPASSGASLASINDLDLEVVSPTGTTYLGNVFSSGVSVAGGTKDSRNNVEQVHLNSPAVGDWTIRVKAAAVNQGTQGYALVISGAVSGGQVAPQNDLCANAILIGDGSTPFTTVGASTDGPDEPALCNNSGFTNIDNDVWFRFPASCDGTATVSLCGSNFDTKIAIYNQQCPASSGLALACNDDFCGSASQVSFPVAFGEVYRIRIGGVNGATGSGNVSISCIAAPPPCPADINHDGAINVSDLLAVINAWGTCSGCAADVNHDNAVNVSDLLAVINGWGTCPP